MDSSLSVPLHLDYSHHLSPQTGPRLHMSSHSFLEKPSPEQHLYRKPNTHSVQAFLHLKKNSRESLITPLRAGKHLNDCCLFDRAATLQQNMLSTFVLLQREVAGTMNLLWCVPKTVYLRCSRMSLQHESLLMILKLLLTLQFGWITA